VFLSVSLQSVCRAQTWDEWFKQKKTQKKYLLEQIAELQLYIGYLEKGYKIVRDGLNTIHTIKNGEFNLHNVFFTSLEKVNPAIQKFARVAEFISVQVSIYNIYSKTLANARACGQFTASELDMFYQSFMQLMDEVMQTLDDMVQVTTDDKLKMTDDDRIQQVTVLQMQCLQQQTNVLKMQNEVQLMARQRMAETIEIGTLRKLYGEK
jgi:hypothetical protein